MKRKLIPMLVLFAILLVVLLSFGVGCKKQTKPTTKMSDTHSFSAVVAGEDGSVFAADETAGLILSFDAEGKELHRYEAGLPVRALVLDGDMLYAAAGDRAGKLISLDLTLRKKGEVNVGHTPVAIALKDGKAYLACRFSNTVGVVSLSSMQLEKSVEVGREPTALAIAGEKLYVGSFLPEGGLDDADVASVVTVIDLGSDAVSDKIALRDGSHSIHGMTASADGSKIYLTHILARYTYPTTQLDRGWVNTNALTEISTADGSLVTYLLDGVERGAANPYDVELSKDGSKLFVTISGCGELAIIDLPAVETAYTRVQDGKDPFCPTANDICNRISFLENASAIKRISLGVTGPRDLFVGDGVYVASYFDGKLLKLDEAGTILSTVALEQPEPTNERKGEILWYDGSACYQGWESCSSCHPEGRSDGFAWDEAGDGYGTPKNTKSMIFATRTPPAMATGVSPAAEENVYESIRGVYLNAALTEEEISCVSDYIRSLVPVESPYLTEDGGYSEAALRGKSLFDGKGCAECHPAPLYTDLRLHASPFAGSDGTAEDREMATPTLTELWRSAPYTHTGYQTDLGEVIAVFAPDLTESEAADLREFLLSIGTVGEQYGVAGVGSAESGRGCRTSITKESTGVYAYLQKLTPDPDEKKPGVVFRLCHTDGTAYATDSATLPEMRFGEITKLPIDLPFADLADGDYLEITFEGVSATPTRLYAEEN